MFVCFGWVGRETNFKEIEGNQAVRFLVLLVNFYKRKRRPSFMSFEI